jgi:hypothetical protein
VAEALRNGGKFHPGREQVRPVGVPKKVEAGSPGFGNLKALE